MEFLVFLFILYIIGQAIRTAARNQARPTLPPDLWDPASLPPEHVLQVGGGQAMVSAPAMVQARRMGEESSSELPVDEAASDAELDLSAAEVVSLERVDVPMSVAARPIPVRDVTLEHEVDWDAEHDRFHKRYVDAPPVPHPTAHGLMDELRDPGGARRAVLLAEILGPPVSMRKGHHA